MSGLSIEAYGVTVHGWDVNQSFIDTSGAPNPATWNRLLPHEATRFSINAVEESFTALLACIDLAIRTGWADRNGGTHLELPYLLPRISISGKEES